MYHESDVSDAALKALESLWLFMMDYQDSPEPEAHDFLIDSGAAVGVCPAWMAGKGRRGRGVPLVSATGHGFVSEGETTLGMRTAGGMSLQGRLQVAPACTNLRRAIVSFGQVVDQGNTVTFDRHGGRITNETTGNVIPIYRSNGVFNMKAELTDPMQARRRAASPSCP